MSYIRPLETDSLPSLNDSTRSRQHRSVTVEEELAVRRNIVPRPGILKYTEHDNAGCISRHTTFELQEQVKIQRDELKKKDALIQHLVSLEAAPKVRHSTEKIEGLYMADKSALERARSDAAALLVKNERAMQQLKENDAEMENKEVKIKELESALEVNRENEARLSNLTHSLLVRVRELEDQLGSYETASSRGEYTIGTLQTDLRSSNDKIVDLEGRIRQLMNERESNAAMVQEAEQRLTSLVAQMAALLNIAEETCDGSIGVEVIIKKLTAFTEEKDLLRGKLLTMEETVTNTQLESKASRETIQRLVAEMERERLTSSKFTVDLETMRAARQEALDAQRGMEIEISRLKETLEASERALAVTKSELLVHEKSVATLEQEIRESSLSTQRTTTILQHFRETLIGALETVFDSLDTSDEGLMEAIRKLSLEAQAYKLKAEESESRVLSITEKLEEKLDLHRELSLRAKQSETEAKDLECKLRAAEGELAAADVLRDGFRSDKEKYLRGLQKLAEVMKMDLVSLDLGLDVTLDALIARADQLIKLEIDALADRTTHVYNLQRRIKSLKEQLESKDLHLDLLRKKLTDLEQKYNGRVDIEKCFETESVRAKKFEKLVAKYKIQLTDARQEIQNLKAQLLGTTELKLRTLEQSKDVQELARKVEDLEEVRHKQTQKICILKDEVATSESQLQEKQVVAENAVQALSSELRTTKNALDSLKLREKQLLDFRGVVSRMLGLDLHSLAVPDYEIITRLEKLIQAHHTTALTTIGLEEALADVEDGYLTRALEATDPVICHSRERSRRKAMRARARVRARSVSPVRVY